MDAAVLATDFELASFDDFTVGDEIRFVTNDNGYGGAGQVWRTGTVKHITPKAITVACDPGQLGRTGRIRRADWSSRSPQRRRKGELLLHYDTPLGSRDRSLSRAQISKLSAEMEPEIRRGWVCNVAVYDGSGADVTHTFPYFADLAF